MKKLAGRMLPTLLRRTRLLRSPPRRRFGRSDRQRFVILYYHRISKKGKPDFLPPALTCSVSRFQEHLLVLKRYFRVLPLEEALGLVRNGDLLPPRTVVLTFDDCWYENMETVAVPLAEAKLPSTFFVSAGDIGREELNPNHRFYYLLSHATSEQLGKAFASVFPHHPMLPTPQGGYRAIRLWLEQRLGYPITSERGRAALGELEREIEVRPSLGFRRDLYMTSDQVRSLPSLGIQVGNHTYSHRQLTSLDPDGQRAEIGEGQRLLSELTGTAVTTFAYPFGGHTDFDEHSVMIAKELEHSSACTVIPGYNDAHTDPMYLHRIDASQLPSGEQLAFYLLWRRVA